MCGGGVSSSTIVGRWETTTPWSSWGMIRLVGDVLLVIIVYSYRLVVCVKTGREVGNNHAVVIVYVR